MCVHAPTARFVRQPAHFLRVPRASQCKSIGQAAAAQTAAVAVSMALARRHARARAEGRYTVANPMATNSANPCTLWRATVDEEGWDQVFAMTMTTRLIFNASPTKMGAGSVLKVARDLATRELEDSVISERMGSSNYMLEGICKAITSPGEYQLDAVWASWVLVVYLCCHPEGRVLLRKTPLTDVDYQTATAFEAYGRAEITRRARLEAQQQQSHGRKRAKSDKGPRNEGVEDPADPADPADLPDNVIDQLAVEEQKTLATKRKRGAKGCASASTSDSSGMLAWWYGALRCDNNSVLMSLIAHSKQAAKEAAGATLLKQADGASGVASNIVIRGISEQNAVSSAQALVPFVGRKLVEMPAVIVWRWNGREYRGLTRTQGEARTTTVHACYMAPATLQPSQDTQLRVAWSVASLQFAPRNDEFTILPGILERLQGASRMAERGKRGELVASRMAGMVLGEAEPPRPTALSGVTRSTISCSIALTVNTSQLDVGNCLGSEMAAMEIATTSDPAVENTGVPNLQTVQQLDDARKEPLCSPSSRLALGIALNEELRTWMVGKSRKNDPCKVLLGVTSPQDRARDAPPIINAEPPPLLTIVDFHLECMPDTTLEAIRDRIKLSDDARCPNVPFGLALHVCGDGATRVPEVLLALNAECRCVDQFVRQARATIWAAMSQASYISNVGPTISAGFANSAISSSKKISVRRASPT